VRFKTAQRFPVDYYLNTIIFCKHDISIGMRSAQILQYTEKAVLKQENSRLFMDIICRKEK
jgi:hypothetical protein